MHDFPPFFLSSLPSLLFWFLFLLCSHTVKRHPGWTDVHMLISTGICNWQTQSPSLSHTHKHIQCSCATEISFSYQPLNAFAHGDFCYLNSIKNPFICRLVLSNQNKHQSKIWLHVLCMLTICSAFLCTLHVITLTYIMIKDTLARLGAILPSLRQNMKTQVKINLAAHPDIFQVWYICLLHPTILLLHFFSGSLWWLIQAGERSKI